MANAFISPAVAALLQEDSKLWEKARTKENPFNIKAPDGLYLSVLAKVTLRDKTKEGNKFLVWNFLYMLVADATTGNKEHAGQQISIRHEMRQRGSTSKEEAYEYLTYDLKALGVANVKDLKTSDFEEVLQGLNTRRKAAVISIKTKDGFKNANLREVVKIEAIQQFLTPETEALLQKALEAEEEEEGTTTTSNGRPRDQIDDMDRAQMIAFNKEHSLGIKSKGQDDDWFRDAIREAIRARSATANSSEEEGEEEEEAPFDTAIDPLAGLPRAELLAIKKKYELSFKTLGRTDDEVRNDLREALKAKQVVPSDPNIDPNEE